MTFKLTCSGYNSCFVNSWFRIGLLAWEANLDIQPFFNHFKAVTYMSVYLSKTEDEDSHAVNQTFKEYMELKLTNYNQLKSFARVYSIKRECSAQETVCHIIQELRLQKHFQLWSLLIQISQKMIQDLFRWKWNKRPPR